jgi:hypothetical protein
MEIFQNFALPENFKSVANKCNNFEKDILKQFGYVYYFEKKDYSKMYELITNDNEIVDDVNFIVKLQHDFGIADNSLQIYGEWAYALSICRTLENFKSCNNEYETYIETKTKTFPENIRTKIKLIKSSIIDMYNFYMHEFDTNQIILFYEKNKNEDFINMNDLNFYNFKKNY